MAKKGKLFTYKFNSGIKGSKDKAWGAVSNLVLNDNGVNKRNGHKSLVFIKDTDLTPLRINGIFDYSYIENGVAQVCKIVHAKDKLFKLSHDFKNPEMIALNSSIKLKDQKSRGFVANGYLFIIGCGDILIYDGKEVKSVYMHDASYIPTTRTGITDQAHGAKYTEGESENILNPRRKNTFIGSTLKRVSGIANMFLLDSNVNIGKKTILEVKIRTRTSEDEANDTTTDYIGINQLGEEVSTIITLRYERTSLSNGSHYFLLEPPRDSLGEEINLKIGEKIYSWNELPFGVSISHGNEIYLGFDVTSPWAGKDNISFEFESKSTYKDWLYDVDIGALTNGPSGKEVMLLTLGGAEIYYTDEERGFFYLPVGNRICLGGGGEKITSLCHLWDSLFGAFKKNSFYRVRLITDSNGYEVFSSSDAEGAYSIYSTTKGDTDCLAFGKRGVFGVSDYKSSTNITSSLYNRSSDISSQLSAYSEEQKENAHALFFGGCHYLFIGDDVFCANLGKKQGSGSYYEYSFTKWTGCGARVAYADSEGIYFGTENGEIRRFFEGYYDLFTSELSKEALTLIVNNEGKFTILTLDESELGFYEENASDPEVLKVRACLGEHERLVTDGAYKAKTGLLIESGGYNSNAIDLFSGDKVAIYDSSGEKIYEGEVISFDPVSKIMEISDIGLIKEGAYYSVYKRLDFFEYELERAEDGYYLVSLGKREKILNIEEITLVKRRPILCEYQAEPFSVLQPNERGNILGAYLYVSDITTGKINVELHTKGAVYKRQSTVAEPLDLNKLSFDGFSLDYPFERVIPFSFYIRNPEKISVKITSQTTEPFSISEFSLMRR